MKYLHITQVHIDKAEARRKTGHYNCAISCPIMLAAREEIAPTWTGAYTFLGVFATKTGREIGIDFLNNFDSRKKVIPVAIRLKDQES